MELLSSMLSHWQGAVAVVLVLGGLIFFHELGHFLIARLFGMGVRTFSLGFGPRLFSRRVGKTDYCLSLIPLGGYVSLVGQGGVEEELESDPDDDRVFGGREMFFNRPGWQRMLVIAAGPVANFILAWLIYWVLAFSQGASYLLPEVGSVIDGSPAATAGLMADDRILSIDGQPITQWSQLSQTVTTSNGAPLEIIVLRGNEQRTLRIEPQPAERTTIFGEKVQSWQVGVVASGKYGHTPLGFTESAVEGVKSTWNMIAFTVEGIAKLFQRVVPLDAVGGPILIAQAVGEQAEQGVVAVLMIAALISVNLGLLNLLPVPVLDGGHIVFLTLEMVFRRPVNEKVQEASARVGVALLVGLMLFATWNDIVRLLS